MEFFGFVGISPEKKYTLCTDIMFYADFFNLFFAYPRIVLVPLPCKTLFKILIISSEENLKFKLFNLL